MASKAVLKQYGINYGKLKRFRGNSGMVFCCWDETRNVLFTGGTEGGELSLSAVSRKEAENIFLDLDSLEYLLEEARLWVKDKEREDEISSYYIYTKTPFGSRACPTPAVWKTCRKKEKPALKRQRKERCMPCAAGNSCWRPQNGR